jgi:hypothetical protein
VKIKNALPGKGSASFMRQCDRYNPPWERYTGTNYMQTEEVVKRNNVIIALLTWIGGFFTKIGWFVTLLICVKNDYTYSR